MAERIVPVASREGGDYFPEAKAARESCAAKGVILLVYGGRKGDGLELQLSVDDLLDAPSVLRRCAADIEAQIVAAGLKDPSA